MHAERSGTPSKFTVLWIAVLLLSLIFLLNYLDRVSKLIAVRSQITEMQTGIQWAERWNLQLKEELKYYASPEYVEEMARAELGYVQPGDNVWVVLEPETATEDQGLVQAESVDRRPEVATAVFLSIDWWQDQFRSWGLVR